MPPTVREMTLPATPRAPLHETAAVARRNPWHTPRTPVALDVVETLISLEPLRQRFVEIGLHESTLEHWFDRLLRDGMALTLAGDYQPFAAVGEAALRVIGHQNGQKM